MDSLLAIDWQELFVPTHSVAEMMLRGTAMYLVLFLVFRFVMPRQSSAIGIADILVIVVIADAAQNGFAKEYRSITEGVVLILTIVFWDMLLNWLSYHVKAFEHLLAPAPLTLVENGRMNRRGMRRELITEEELRAQMRLHGISDVAKIKRACLEPGGDISFVENDEEPNSKSRQRKP